MQCPSAVSLPRLPLQPQSSSFFPFCSISCKNGAAISWQRDLGKHHIKKNKNLVKITKNGGTDSMPHVGCCPPSPVAVPIQAEGGLLMVVSSHPLRPPRPVLVSPTSKTANAHPANGVTSKVFTSLGTSGERTPSGSSSRAARKHFFQWDKRLGW